MTGLFGSKRVSKNTLRIHAYGSVDELNTCIGYLIALLATERLLDKSARGQLSKELQNIQRTLFVIGAQLATPQDATLSIPRITEQVVRDIEQGIDVRDAQLAPLTHFLLPSGTPAASWCHVVRTVCRRVERDLVALHEQEPVSEVLLQYMNRLSDYFFVVARFLNQQAGVSESEWRTHTK